MPVYGFHHYYIVQKSFNWSLLDNIFIIIIIQFCLHQTTDQIPSAYHMGGRLDALDDALTCYQREGCRERKDHSGVFSASLHTVPNCTFFPTTVNVARRELDRNSLGGKHPGCSEWHRCSRLEGPSSLEVLFNEH